MPGPTPQKEGSAAQREHKRSAMVLSGDIDSPTRGNLSAITKDLSAGGAALEVEYPLIEGEAIRLSLYLVYEGIEDERTPPLVVGARVQWIAEGDDGTHSAGVRFEQITDAQKAWIEQILRVAG
jgi:hypothetical protein